MANGTGTSLIRVDTHSLLRRLVGVGLGFVMTVLLFLVMQALIKSDRDPFTDAPTGRIVDFVRLLDDTPIEVRDRKPPPPPIVDEPPPEMPKPNFEASDSSLGVDISFGSIDPTINFGGTGGYSSDGEYLPIVKVKPIYPRRAQTRGIEGYVLVQFTVTKTGAITDPVILESEPPGIFDRAAINAAKKFKYKPKVVNGEPIDVAGVPHKITFKLADE